MPSPARRKIRLAPDMERLIALHEAQRSAGRTRPAPDLATRLDHLERLRTVLVENQSDIIAAIDADFGGRPALETRLLEIAPLISAIRHARRNLRRWMRPEARRIDPMFQPAKAWVQHQPLGVIGILSPWNYPLFLSIGPLIDALAAGNRVMLKPSERTPVFADLLRDRMAGAFEPTEVAVVTGGPDVAQAFAALPFDHLLFTGSSAVGRKVMRAAAENLTPVTLELGGKSPAIVGPDADLQRAARSIAFGKFLNGGQTCIAPDYVLAPRGDAESLARMIARHAAEAWPDRNGHSACTALLSASHRERLAQAVDEARAAGALVLDTGSPSVDRLNPTIVLEPPADGLLGTEEIFGPVLPIFAYDALADALDRVNDGPRPLALYAFSRNRREQDRILAATISGGATINGTILHAAQPELPFGGVGASGMGAYHGEAGFRRFSHARSVHRPGAWNGVERLGPPYGWLARRVATWLTSRR